MRILKYTKIMTFMLLMLCLSFTVFAATVTRSVPSSIQPGSTFSVTYTVSDAPTSWGVSLVDMVSGGCMFPAGNELRTVMLYTDGNTKTISMTAPSSGSCTFTGDYKFGTDNIINFPSKNIVITVGVNSSSSTTQPPSVTTTTQQGGSNDPSCSNFWEDPLNNCKFHNWVIPGLIGIGVLFLMNR